MAGKLNELYSQHITWLAKNCIQLKINLTWGKHCSSLYLWTQLYSTFLWIFQPALYSSFLIDLLQECAAKYLSCFAEVNISCVLPPVLVVNQPGSLTICSLNGVDGQWGSIKELRCHYCYTLHAATSGQNQYNTMWLINLCIAVMWVYSRPNASCPWCLIWCNTSNSMVLYQH